MTPRTLDSIVNGASSMDRAGSPCRTTMPPRASSASSSACPRRIGTPVVVDQRELGRSLLGLGEQAFGLVEQPGILERDPHACRERAEESDVGVVERIGLD